MQIKTEVMEKNIVGKLANAVIRGIKHNKPIKNIIQKPIKSNLLDVLFLINRAAEVPPIKPAAIVTILNNKTETTMTKRPITKSPKNK